jgi:hypothetical protein
MTEHILHQTGQEPIAIDGECIWADSTKTHNTTRWFELSLYRCENGDRTLYLAHVEYRSQWEAEAPGHDEVYESVHAPDVLDCLKGYNPCQHARLRPENDESQKRTNGPRNEDTRRQLRRQWEGLVSGAAKALGVVRRVGRPSTMGEDAKTTGVKMSAGLVSEIEAALGKGETFSEWVRDACEQKLTLLAGKKS